MANHPLRIEHEQLTIIKSDYPPSPLFVYHLRGERGPDAKQNHSLFCEQPAVWRVFFLAVSPFLGDAAFFLLYH